MKLTAPAFTQGTHIPVTFTCDGSDVSPALSWSAPPEGTQRFVLIVEDPDAPGRTWVHWVLYDLPATERGLAEGIPPEATLPSGARQGLNGFGRIGYGGPCPPPGSTHRYYFRLYALDQTLALKPRATKTDVDRAMKGHVLAQAELMGRYQRA